MSYGAQNYTADFGGNIAVPGGHWPDYVRALPVIMGEGRVRELARSVADGIITAARTDPGPVVWITGNAYWPPMRDIAEAELVYQAENNRNGELFAWFGETVREHLDDADVELDCPENDNALYAVDLTRWQYKDPQPDDIDDLNGEWEPVEN